MIKVSLDGKLSSRVSRHESGIVSKGASSEILTYPIDSVHGRTICDIAKPITLSLPATPYLRPARYRIQDDGSVRVAAHNNN